MGYARPRPKRLAAKLFLIRRRLGLSQAKLGNILGITEYSDISKYEHDKNEPSLMILLAYARAAGVRVEDIIDDDMTLQF